jgi:branched-chain amino acid aminotransferase
VRVVRLNGREVDAAAPALTPDDPLARAGDGLIETMRARHGVVFRLDRHLARMAASAAALGLTGLPSAEAVRHEVARAVAAAGGGDLRVRVAVSAAPTIWVEAAAEEPLPVSPPAVAAVTVPGGWQPGLAVAEHKTASRAGWAWADRRAAAAGAGAALLLDDAGRMGEATAAAVFVRTGGRVLTAPVTGLLPGIGREVMLGFIPGVEQRAAGRAEWESAEEVVLVSALRGVVAVTGIDGRPVGTGRPGSMARGQAAAYRELVERETRAGVGG